MKSFLLSVCLLTIAFVNVNAEITWPETVNEWGLEGVTNIATNEIVYYNNAFYQCTAAIAVEAGKEPATTTTNYTKVADCRMWEVGMSHINFEEYVIYKGFVYQCTAADGTDAWSSGWNPTEWEAPNYKTICGIALIGSDEEPEPEPTIDEFLPDNYVGYWNADFSWHPGFHTIQAGGVYPCIAKTHTPGGEDPASSLGGNWGYWDASIGNEADLLSLEGITIPAWIGDNAWPVGAIVALEGSYYKCIAQTHTPGGENPVASIDGGWGYWEVLDLNTGLDKVTKNDIAYTIQDGRLYFSNSPVKLQVQLYNVVGQLINETAQNGIELPNTGAFIVKAVVDGNPASFKVVRLK